MGKLYTFDPSLYLVLDPSECRRRPVEVVLAQAIRGGVTLVQVREKNCSNEEFIDLAERALAVAKFYGVPLLVNDRVDVAIAVGAQGVHLGQHDMDWREARRLLGAGAVIGISAETVEQAAQLKLARVSYVAASPVYWTATKPELKHPLGVEGVRKMREACPHPIVGIGGFNRDTLPEVLEAGASGVAIVSAITRAENPEAAARELKAVIERRCS